MSNAAKIGGAIGSFVGGLTAWVMTLALVGAAWKCLVFDDDWGSAALWVIAMALLSIWGQIDMIRRAMRPASAQAPSGSEGEGP